MAVKYIEMDLKYVDEWKGLEWVLLAQDTVKLGAFMKTVMNLLFPKYSGRISRKLRKISYSQKMTALHGLSRFCKSAP
jgi:hypothetical protein